MKPAIIPNKIISKTQDNIIFKDNEDKLGYSFLEKTGIKNIDEKIKKAQELKDQGMDAHNNGDHAKSEKLLNEALALFKS